MYYFVKKMKKDERLCEKASLVIHYGGNERQVSNKGFYSIPFEKYSRTARIQDNKRYGYAGRICVWN